MRGIFIAITVLLLGAAGCAVRQARVSEPPKSPVELTVHDYKEGDRSALLQVENNTKRILVYDGPYTQTLTTNGWESDRFEVPEMGVLARPHRAGPSQSDAWWVRVPPAESHWRAFIRCKLLPSQNATNRVEEFTVWSPEQIAK